jgi:hypothetical protein
MLPGRARLVRPPFGKAATDSGGVYSLLPQVKVENGLSRAVIYGRQAFRACCRAFRPGLVAICVPAKALDGEPDVDAR